MPSSVRTATSTVPDVASKLAVCITTNWRTPGWCALNAATVVMSQVSVVENGTSRRAGVDTEPAWPSPGTTAETTPYDAVASSAAAAAIRASIPPVSRLLRLGNNQGMETGAQTRRPQRHVPSRAGRAHWGGDLDRPGIPDPRPERGGRNPAAEKA
jgi:hypothetical protein